MWCGVDYLNVGGSNSITGHGPFHLSCVHGLTGRERRCPACRQTIQTAPVRWYCPSEGPQRLANEPDPDTEQFRIWNQTHIWARLPVRMDLPLPLPYRGRRYEPYAYGRIARARRERWAEEGYETEDTEPDMESEDEDNEEGTAGDAAVGEVAM